MGLRQVGKNEGDDIVLRRTQFMEKVRGGVYGLQQRPVAPGLRNGLLAKLRNE